jgi:GNAT superfamily N-acetyltransferase
VEFADDVIQVTRARTGPAVLQAAAIWAQATKRRDQSQKLASAEEKVPGIERRLALDGAELFLARRADRPVGFAVVAPRGETLELFYLAVDPEAWGSGVGTRLLQRVDEHAREIGRESLELWVIDDNERAIRVYQRSGWAGTEQTKMSAGRMERRFTRAVGLARPGS